MSLLSREERREGTISMEFEILLTLSFGLPIIGIAGMTTRTILTLVKRSSNRARGIRLSTKSAFYCLYIMQWILGGLGLLFFYIATHEPAVWIPVPDAGKVVDGWQAMIVGFPYYGINGWFLILPLILVWIGLLRDIRLQIYPFVIQVACALVAMSA